MSTILGILSSLILTRILAHCNSSILSVLASMSKNRPHPSPILRRMSRSHKEMGRPSILTQASLFFSSSITHPVLWLHFSSRTSKPLTDIAPSFRAFLASIFNSNSNRALPSSNLARPKLPFKPHSFDIWVPQLLRSSPLPSVGSQLPTRQ